MEQAIPPFLLLADVRGAWDASPFALSVFDALEARGGRGTLVLAGASQVPAYMKSRRIFAQSYLADPLAGKVIAAVMARDAHGRVAVVHAFGARLCPFAQTLSRRLGCKYFTSVFRYEESLRGLKVDPDSCAGVFAEDATLADSVRDSLSAGAADVTVLPLSCPPPPAGHSHPGEVLTVAAIGPYKPECGMVRLVEAAAKLREAGLALELVLEGSGKGEDDVRRFVAASRMSAVTTFVDDAVEYRRVVGSADIIVFAGDARGATLPLLAAMFAERPVIVCDTTGIEDLVFEKRGVLRAEPDASSVADTIASVSGGARTRAAIGSAAARTALAARPWAPSVDVIVSGYLTQAR